MVGHRFQWSVFYLWFFGDERSCDGPTGLSACGTCTVHVLVVVSAAVGVLCSSSSIWVPPRQSCLQVPQSQQQHRPRHQVWFCTSQTYGPWSTSSAVQQSVLPSADLGASSSPHAPVMLPFCCLCPRLTIVCITYISETEHFILSVEGRLCVTLHLLNVVPCHSVLYVIQWNFLFLLLQSLFYYLPAQWFKCPSSAEIWYD